MGSIAITEFAYEYAKPATIMYNKIIQTCDWPTQWKVEQAVVLNKCKTRPPQDEEDLRTISKTQLLSKVLETRRVGPVDNRPSTD